LRHRSHGGLALCGRRIAAALERNQRSVFEASVDSLSVRELAARFQTIAAPTAEAGPDATPLPGDHVDDLGEPTLGHVAPKTADDIEVLLWRTRSAGQVRFRVVPPPPSAATRRAVFVSAGLVVAVGSYQMSIMSSASNGQLVWSGAVMLSVIGGILLLAFRYVPIAYCSEPSCGRSLKRPVPVCPGCGAGIAGDIATAADRFDAHDALDWATRSAAQTRSREAAKKLGVRPAVSRVIRPRRAQPPPGDRSE